MPSGFGSFLTYTCPFCQQPALTEPAFVLHVFEQHQDDRTQVVCPICAMRPGGRSDYYSRDFHGHLQARHSNRDPGFSPFGGIPEPRSSSSSKAFNPYIVGLEPPVLSSEVKSSGRISKIIAPSEAIKGSDSGPDRSDQWRSRLSSPSNHWVISSSGSLVLSSPSLLSSSSSSSPSSSPSCKLSVSTASEAPSPLSASGTGKTESGERDPTISSSHDDQKEFVSRLLFSSLFTEVSNLPDFDLSSASSTSPKESDQTLKTTPSVDVMNSLNPFGP